MDMAAQAAANKAKQEKIEASNQDKDFKCQMCGKTYLSNPALYLHMKIKH